ncbi:putative isochorismatase family protein [Lyophyllum shimeji]|uniref:Protein PBN1 n=1 Tax=Lyophyllum shimeji TaxID=47721 RepID=A0A9P3UU15_LYOSH|nr:putative isochorismatase family protein [Lyophyllum shimeji]
MVATPRPADRAHAIATDPRRVLLLLDIQQAMLADPPIGVPASKSVKVNLERILAHARKARPQPLIVHVRNTGDVGEPDEPHTAGWQLIFPPQPEETVIDKRKNNAFAGTDLGDIIPSDAEIVVAGFQTDFSIRATCSDALKRGNEVLLIRGAHATHDRIEVLHGGGITPASRIEAEIEAELEEAGIVNIHLSTVLGDWLDDLLPTSRSLSFHVSKIRSSSLLLRCVRDLRLSADATTGMEYESILGFRAFKSFTFAGYHPVSITTVNLEEPEVLKDSKCALYLHFTLPPLIFVDPYELVHHEASYTFRHWGTSNLELPVSAVPQNSSHLLLAVTVPDDKREVEVRLPLHLRYGDLSKGSLHGYHQEEIAWPTGFLECPVSVLSAIASGLPRLPSEIASLFDLSSAKFIPISHSVPNGTNLVRAPTGSLEDLAFVEFGTMFTILLAFLQKGLRFVDTNRHIGEDHP